MYSAQFLMDLFASMPTGLMRAFTVLAVLCSIVSLALLGGIVRHATGIYTSAFKPWGIDISLGLTIAAAWFVLRSFLYHTLPLVPPILEQEATFVALALVAVFKRPLLVTAMREMVQGSSLFTTACIFVSIWTFGYWRAFDLLPASSDPGAISVLLDTYRNAGHSAFSFSWFNTNLPGYPNGIMTLGWAFANPLLTSLSIIHLWPHITLTLLVFTLFDWLIGWRALSTRQWCTCLALVVIVRLVLGSFDVSLIWFHLEGVSKRSVGFLCALALALAFAPGRSNSGPRRETSRQALTNFLALWPLSLVTMINPINAFISAAIGLVIVALQTRRRVFYSTQSVLGLGAFLVSTALMMVQDGSIISQTGQKGLPCKILHNAIPFCQWTPAELASAQHTKLEVAPQQEEAHWSAFLPLYFENPKEFLYPTDTRMFHEVSTSIRSLKIIAVIAFFFAVSSLFFRRKGTNAKSILSKRQLARYAATIALVCFFLVALVLFSLAQTYLLATIGVNVRHLLKFYSYLAFINVWQVAFYLLVISLVWLISINSEKLAGAFFHKRGSKTLACFSLWIICVAIVIASSRQNFSRATALRGRLHLTYGSQTGELASILGPLAKNLPSDEPIMLASAMSKTGPELWNIPAGESIAFQLYLPNPVLFSYSGQWPLGSPSIVTHFNQMCGPTACEYLRSQGVRWLVALGEKMTFCGFQDEVYAARSKCFAHNFDISSRSSLLTASAFRLGDLTPPFVEATAPKF